MLTTKADSWFSKFIRLRDADENACAKCCTCSTYKPVKEMDCAHFIKRQHMATRFSEMNCATQCKKCNAFEQGRDADFERFLIGKYGEQEVMLLKMQKRASMKVSKFWLDLIAKTYKERATELSKEKSIPIW